MARYLMFWFIAVLRIPLVPNKLPFVCIRWNLSEYWITLRFIKLFGSRQTGAFEKRAFRAAKQDIHY